MMPDKFFSLFVYCPETGKLTRKVGGRQAKAGSEVGKTARSSYRKVRVGESVYYVHRIAYLLMTGEWPPDEIDHINGNRLDNRWCNLRPCTHLRNGWNQRRPTNNTSGVTGVNMHHGKWLARISVMGRRINLGFYVSKSDAIEARKQAEQVYFQGLREVSDIVSST